MSQWDGLVIALSAFSAGACAGVVATTILAMKTVQQAADDYIAKTYTKAQIAKAEKDAVVEGNAQSTLDPDLRQALLDSFRDNEAAYRHLGRIEPDVLPPPTKGLE